MNQTSDNCKTKVIVILIKFIQQVNFMKIRKLNPTKNREKITSDLKLELFQDHSSHYFPIFSEIYKLHKCIISLN